MENVKRMLGLLLLAVLMGTLMTTAVLADETQCVWLSVTEDPQAGTVTALIVTNTTVTDGLVKLSYDSSALTYQALAANGDYVSHHAVNPNEAGTVKISWVAPGEYTADGAGLTLMTVTFTGTDASSLELSGAVYDAAGSQIALEPTPSVPPTEEPTTPGGGDNSQTGDDTPLVPILIVMGLCLVGIIAMVVILIRKGRKK